MEYYIFISNDCNLNCSYCSILIDAKKHNIPLEPNYEIATLNKFIDSMQIKTDSRVADIVLFGGEPTLNYEFIIRLINTLTPLSGNYKIRYMLHTNGLLLYELPNSILKRIDAIMLSVNYYKIPTYNLHEGYFNTIASNIKSIKLRKSIPIIGRLTITEKTSLFTSVMQTHHFFDYIHWQIENCFEFNDFDTFYKSYTFDLSNLLELWYQYLQRGVLINLIPFISCYDFISKNEKPRSFNCGYNDSMIYIQTDGYCYTCAEDFTSNCNLIGSIQEGISFSDFSLLKTDCCNCPYLNVCQGRCGRMHKDLPLNRIKQYCQLNKTQFDFFNERRETISAICNSKDINIKLDNDIFMYTEYTP